jgi:hypothetical protein
VNRWNQPSRRPSVSSRTMAFGKKTNLLAPGRKNKYQRLSRSRKQQQQTVNESTPPLTRILPHRHAATGDISYTETEEFDPYISDDEAAPDDDIVTNISSRDAFQESDYLSCSDSQSRRLQIGTYLEFQLGSPKSVEWPGRNGSISRCCSALNGDQNCKSFRRTVKMVFTHVARCQEDRVPYLGEGMNEAVGRKAFIDFDSVYAQIIADSIESGNSISITTYIVNLHRKDNSESSFTKAAVYSCYERMQPRMQPQMK